jgi:SPP1 gp7 family putative phage head morphogenesis protein
VTPAERVARQQKAERLRADRALQQQILDEYGRVWRRISADLDELTAQITAARARGETVNAAWLNQRDRLESLERQTRAQMRFVIDVAERAITAAQADALTAGQVDARALLLESLGPPPSAATPFAPALPVAQLELMVGRAMSGQPLGDLLARLGPLAAESIRRELVMGVALGRNPRVTARKIKGALGGNAARALTIARTETLGVYRAAALETYRSNRAVVTGWVWLAQLSQRTCAVCWAMHGSFHTLDEGLASHPSCRCTQVPSTRSWAELGFPDVPESGLEVEAGAVVFARAPAELQRAVLGKAKYEAYAAGRLALSDLAEPTLSPVWGPGLRERSLRDALQVAA